MSIVLALGAALCWGTADFLAGNTSRHTAALIVLFASQWFGFALVAITALALGAGHLTGEELIYAVLAGMSMALALGALYRALAVGAMAVAAPIAATGVVIPVAIGLAGGDSPSGLQAIGLGAAVIGVALCSFDPAPKGSPRHGALATGVGLALLAALGGGLASTSLAAASSAGVLWVLLIQRATAGTLTLALVLGTGDSPRPPRQAVPAIVAVGVFDVVATGLFILATVNGELSIVAVVGASYPVVTVLLAFAVLSERLAIQQALGAAMALLGVAAIAGG